MQVRTKKGKELTQQKCERGERASGLSRGTKKKEREVREKEPEREREKEEEREYERKKSIVL